MIKNKQVIGIGTDIELVKRFEDCPFDKNKEFYRNIFDEEEIKECMAKPDAHQSFAVRFAAKEAIIKGTSAVVKLSFKDISIRKGKNNAPSVEINRIKEKIYAQVSLSHTKEHALACAIIFDDECKEVRNNENCCCKHIHTE